MEIILGLVFAYLVAGVGVTAYDYVYDYTKSINWKTIVNWIPRLIDILKNSTRA